MIICALFWDLISDTINIILYLLTTCDLIILYIHIDLILCSFYDFFLYMYMYILFLKCKIYNIIYKLPTNFDAKHPSFQHHNLWYKYTYIHWRITSNRILLITRVHQIKAWLANHDNTIQNVWLNINIYLNMFQSLLEMFQILQKKCFSIFFKKKFNMWGFFNWDFSWI